MFKKGILVPSDQRHQISLRLPKSIHLVHSWVFTHKRYGSSRSPKSVHSLCPQVFTRKRYCSLRSPKSIHTQNEMARFARQNPFTRFAREIFIHRVNLPPLTRGHSYIEKLCLEEKWSVNVLQSFFFFKSKFLWSIPNLVAGDSVNRDRASGFGFTYKILMNIFAVFGGER